MTITHSNIYISQRDVIELLKNVTGHYGRHGDDWANAILKQSVSNRKNVSLIEAKKKLSYWQSVVDTLTNRVKS